MLIPASLILDAMAVSLASDTLLLAATPPPQVALVIAPFTPSHGLAIGSLTLASFTGSAPLIAGTGTQQEFVDPLTGNRVVQMLEPLGGWHWQATAGTGLPQAVYGYVLTDTTGLVVYGSALFPSPVIIAAVGQGCDIPEVNYQLPDAMIG
jgi:hypothetical protein